MPAERDAELQHPLHLMPKLHGPPMTATRDAETHIPCRDILPMEGKAFNQVPEDSRLPGEVRFAKKGIENEDDPPLGSIEVKWSGALLLWGLLGQRPSALSTLRSHLTRVLQVCWGCEI